MKVLIPSDDPAFLINFAHGYRRLGHEPSFGAINFWLETARSNFLHILWPEELIGPLSPSASVMSKIDERLYRRAQDSCIVFTVNNIYPHGKHHDPAWHDAYSLFFRHADVIHHFSAASRKLVDAEYPEFCNGNHLVRTGFNYELVRGLRHLDRETARRRYGFSDDECVFLVFGAIRDEREVTLLQAAWRMADIPGKRLFLVCRYIPQGGRLARRLKRARYQLWCHATKAVVIEEYISDSQVPEVFDAADAVLILRHESLSSGIPCLAMTLGRYVIAPRLHAHEEYLAGLDNGLYSPGSPESLSSEMQFMAEKNREVIGQRNEAVALSWKWEDTLSSIISSVPDHRQALLSKD